MSNTNKEEFEVDIITLIDDEEMCIRDRYWINSDNAV